MKVYRCLLSLSNRIMHLNSQGSLFQSLYLLKIVDNIFVHKQFKLPTIFFKILLF